MSEERWSNERCAGTAWANISAARSSSHPRLQIPSQSQECADDWPISEPGQTPGKRKSSTTAPLPDSTHHWGPTLSRLRENPAMLCGGPMALRTRGTHAERMGGNAAQKSGREIAALSKPRMD
eukprot:4622425-Pyramimonas_sp.AAC.1